MFDVDLDDLSTADLLAAAAEYAQDQEHAAVGILRTTLAFADRNAVVEWPGREPLPGYERLRVYGGEGCPGVAEFAPVELGAVLGLSSGAASSLLGEALALRHRLPRVWAAVLSGNAIAWRARKIAHACLSLSLEAAAIVDRRVAGIVNTVTPGRLKRIVTAAIWQADPAQAQADAEAAAKTRGVFITQSDPADDHGTKRIFIRAASGDVIRFDATIDDLAHALKALGDPDPLDQRRAKAIGWIADPAAAHNLLQAARHLARTHDHAGTTPTTADRTSADRTSADRTSADRTSADRTSADRTSADRTSADRTSADRTSADRTSADRTSADRTSADRTSADRTSADRAGVYRVSVEQAATELADITQEDATRAGADRASVGRVSDDGAGAGGGEAFTWLGLAETLEARLAGIKQGAYSGRFGVGGATLASGGSLGGGRGRGSRHTLYVHLTDRTLATGTGVLRVEELGPLLAGQLGELLGHDQVIVKPVIDLHDQVSVDSYEIPDRIRERVRLRHPVDMFPYGAAEATRRMDLDHIAPYSHAVGQERMGRAEWVLRGDSVKGTGLSGVGGRGGSAGSDGQTSLENLVPQGRLHHRAKTFGGWRSRRLAGGGVEWVSPHGFVFVVDHAGTRRLAGVSCRVAL
ncbi:hypothetical protein ACXJJ3_36765 [Kribbella sp. WER1]